MKIQGEENKLRSKFQTGLQEVIEAEEVHVRDEFKKQNRMRNDGLSRQLEELAYEHSHKKKHTQEQCQEELDKATSYMQSQVDKEKKNQTREYTKCAKDHADEINDIHNSHEDVCKKIKQEFQLKVSLST